YDEMLASQLALALVRAHLRRAAGRRAAPSLIGEGPGGGSRSGDAPVPHGPTPTPDSSPQGGGEKPPLLARLHAALPLALKTPPPPASPHAAPPFALPAGQWPAANEISRDLAKPERMLRLLQGDVGAGKTVVALFACARAIAAGSQAALMAPTEILARQHLKT